MSLGYDRHSLIFIEGGKGEGEEGKKRRREKGKEGGSNKGRKKGKPCRGQHLAKGRFMKGQPDKLHSGFSCYQIPDPRGSELLQLRDHASHPALAALCTTSIPSAQLYSSHCCSPQAARGMSLPSLASDVCISFCPGPAVHVSLGHPQKCVLTFTCADNASVREVASRGAT